MSLSPNEINAVSNVRHGEDDVFLTSLIGALHTAKAAIEDETKALRSRQRVNYSEYHRRKDLCLLDLTRRSRDVPDLTRSPKAIAALTALRDAIVENQSILKIHLEAAREVAHVVMRAIAEEESDKTYTAACLPRVRKP